ncbi:MAG: hypothetical protein MI922_21365, partial [Bacteroidales bacterium]|nr:hypothetical protein [Bacteroidales bacterium]
MSHKFLIFFALTFLIQFNCYGKLYYKSYGFVVTNDNDTIKCDFKLPGIKTNGESLMIDLEAIQKKIISVDKKSNKELVYSPSDIKSFQFHFDYDQFNFESKTLDWLKNEKKKLKKKFFQREVHGPLNMYMI